MVLAWEDVQCVPEGRSDVISLNVKRLNQKLKEGDIIDSLCLFDDNVVHNPLK